MYSVLYSSGYNSAGVNIKGLRYIYIYTFRFACCNLVYRSSTTISVGSSLLLGTLGRGIIPLELLPRWETHYYSGGVDKG